MRQQKSTYLTPGGKRTAHAPPEHVDEQQHNITG